MDTPKVDTCQQLSRVQADKEIRRRRESEEVQRHSKVVDEIDEVNNLILGSRKNTVHVQILLGETVLQE